MTTQAIDKCRKMSQLIGYLVSGFLVYNSWSFAQAAIQATNFTQIPVGFTESGYPYRGSPDAPIILEEYSDYLCPYCSRHFKNTYPALLEQYVNSGKVQYVYRDFPLAALHPTAAQGHAAALCTAEQGADLFWKMHDELFRSQQQWNRLQDPVDFLAEIAEKIGVDRTRFDECMTSDRNKPVIEKSNAAGKELGFKGTPSFQFIQRQTGDHHTMVGSRQLATFQAWLDALLAGNKPPESKKSELPFWAKLEGLAPDPEQSGYTKAGDQYKGSPEAPLTVIEFSDFQCSSCRKHTMETQPDLDKQFVDTGKVRWVFKHFPLHMHPHAPVAAVAAECAAEQDQFWTLHHLLLDKQEQWANATNADAQLVALANTLELNETKFVECFNGRKALERVLADLYDAGGFVRMSPTFFVIAGDKVTTIKGRQSPKQFGEVLQKILKSTQPEAREVSAKTVELNE